MRVGHDEAQIGRESAALHWQRYADHGGAAAFVRQIRSLRTADTLGISERLGELDVPARVVWGVADPFQKIGYGERLAEDLGSPLIRIEGAKHFVPEDHPGPVAAAVNDVVASVGSGG